MQSRNLSEDILSCRQATRGRLILTALATLVLTGCPIGTPNDHSRPIGHGDMTIDVAETDDVILFNANGRGGRDLYLLQLDDLTVRCLGETPEYEVMPRFSPDGTRIACTAGVPGDRADHLFTMDADGTNRKQLTSGDANDVSPAWSPDGTLITFARDKTHIWGGLAANWSEGGVICVINADGTQERQLTADEHYAVAPCFSTDGRSVIYAMESGLYSVPISGTEPATRLGPAKMHIALSPDGQRVVFADGTYSGDHELFVSRVDGSQKSQITKSDQGCFHPVWNRTGTTVYFLKIEWPDGPMGHPKSSLWSVTPNGREELKISDVSLFDDPSNWTP